MQGWFVKVPRDSICKLPAKLYISGITRNQESRKSPVSLQQVTRKMSLALGLQQEEDRKLSARNWSPLRVTPLQLLNSLSFLVWHYMYIIIIWILKPNIHRFANSPFSRSWLVCSLCSPHCFFLLPTFSPSSLPPSLSPSFLFLTLDGKNLYWEPSCYTTLPTPMQCWSTQSNSYWHWQVGYIQSLTNYRCCYVPSLFFWLSYLSHRHASTL